MRGVQVLDLGACEGLWTSAALESGASQVIAFESGFLNKQGIPAEEILTKFGVECVFARVCDEDGDKKVKIDGHGYSPGFMKIDVEGDEMLVLKGAEQTIKMYKPKMMIESHDYMYPGRKEEIQKLLKSWGREMTSSKHIDGGLSQTYHLYYL